MLHLAAVRPADPWVSGCRFSEFNLFRPTRPHPDLVGKRRPAGKQMHRHHRHPLDFPRVQPYLGSDLRDTQRNDRTPDPENREMGDAPRPRAEPPITPCEYPPGEAAIRTAGAPTASASAPTTNP